MSNDDEVGYGKPPKNSQFKKGQSGNPKGRLKGMRNLESIVRDEAYSKISIKEHGKTRTVTKVEALMKRMMAKGIQGDNKAASIALSLMQEYLPTVDPEAARRVPLNEQEMKILTRHAEFLAVMEEAADDDNDT